MMNVDVQNISKRFQYQWILKDFSAVFKEHSVTGIKGPNGSGKSTFLQILSGYLSYTEGNILYTYQNKTISRQHIYKYLCMSAPYIQLDEEFTPLELYRHYSKFKDFHLNSDQAFLSALNFKDNSKIIKNLSSGMKQKVQLLLTLQCKSPLLLLDEPSSYLDDKNKAWFMNMLDETKYNKTLIIASNDAVDFQLCDRIISLS